MGEARAPRFDDRVRLNVRVPGWMVKRLEHESNLRAASTSKLVEKALEFYLRHLPPLLPEDSDV